MGNINVFVYGTLKPGESNYQSYCGGKTVRETKAYTRGKLYHLSLGYPALAEGDNKIEGYLLSFADASILTSLDELEDYQPERSPNLNHYIRQLVPIFDGADNFLEEAWVYLMSLENIKQFKGIPIESASWNSRLFTY